jgi:uncharacterized protein
MIRLAANWSTTLEKLLRKIDPPVDYLKIPLERDCAQQLSAARPLRPVLLHGWGPPYRAGMREIPDADLLRELAKTSGTPYLSVHLDMQPEDFGSEDSNGEPNELEAIERITSSIRSLREITGLDVLLENCASYSWSERPAFMVSPEFIATVLEAANANLLLDLAHVRVSAYHRGETELEYLERLPLQRVREIHVSGPRLEPEGLRDRHLPLTDTDYNFLEHALTKAKFVHTITLEYAGIPDIGRTREGREIRIPRNDPSALLEQIARLDTIRKRYGGTQRTAPKLPAGWHLDRRLREQFRAQMLEQLEFAHVA